MLLHWSIKLSSSVAVVFHEVHMDSLIHTSALIHVLFVQLLGDWLSRVPCTLQWVLLMMLHVLLSMFESQTPKFPLPSPFYPRFFLLGDQVFLFEIFESVS